MPYKLSDAEASQGQTNYLYPDNVTYTSSQPKGMPNDEIHYSSDVPSTGRSLSDIQFMDPVQNKLVQAAVIKHGGDANFSIHSFDKGIGGETQMWYTTPDNSTRLMRERDLSKFLPPEGTK